MAYYDSFIAINKSPRENYKEQLQEVVNQLFINAPTYYEDVEEEDSFGSQTYHKINVRVNNLVDAKTGQRVNDDFKKLIFEDIHYMPPIGTRYKFNNNIWIVFSTDNVKTDTASVYVRRCNNTLNTQDEYGNIHQEPCYVDYSLTETQIFKEYSIDIPRGRIVIYCQLNQYTDDINVNTRFIIGDDAYKVRVRDRFDRRETFDKSSIHLLRFQLDYDNIAEDDNLELQIANYKKLYSFDVTNEIINVAGTSGKIDCKVLLNNEVVDNVTPVFESSDSSVGRIINETEGTYQLLRAGECEFKCTLKENENIEFNIKVIVKNSIEDDAITNKISPNINYIKLNNIQEYSIFEYVNGEITDTKFEINFYNVPKRNYDCYVEDNRFAIKNLRAFDEPLLVVCKNLNNGSVVEKEIELGGLF